MKIKLQQYSLISNEWIEKRIKTLNKSYTHSNINGNVIKCNFINAELEYLEELKQQLIPSVELPQQEISDEEIEKQAESIDSGIHRMFFKTGAKWYREQFKQPKKD